VWSFIRVIFHVVHLCLAQFSLFIAFLPHLIAHMIWD
jgi:hypothetical protein